MRIDFLTCVRENKDSDLGTFNSKLKPLIYPYFFPFNIIFLLLSTSTLISSPSFFVLTKKLAEKSTNLLAIAPMKLLVPILNIKIALLLD